MNPETISATEYHQATSYRRHRLTAHSLDWANLPRPFKRYPKLPRVLLPRSTKLPQSDYFDLVNRRETDHLCSKPLDMQTIASVFRLSLDVTARSLHADPPVYFRSVASAGALYPFELYLAVHHLDGLDAGVYHYDLLDFSLNVLRLASVSEIPLADRGAVATFYISGIFFRSAWKYRSRAYRYVLLDAGHLMENLRLALIASDIVFSIHLDFDDQQAATLLGLDPQREVCLACIHLHDAGAATAKKMRPGDADDPQPLGREILEASTVSDKMVAYTEITAFHQAGNAVADVSTEGHPDLDATTSQPTSWIDLDPPDHSGVADYGRVLRQRRSRRNFIPASVSRDDLMRFVSLMTAQMGRAAAVPSACRSALSTGLLVGASMPIAPGFYLFDADRQRLGRVSGGRLIEPMAAACLDQMWLQHAALHLLFMTDLAALDNRWGARGYRYALIEAGRLGQQAYLAATAMGWGACGIGAIYDREAAELLNLADDGVLLYLVGIGPIKSS